MSVGRIPIADASSPHFSFTVDLDGATYTFVFRWNTRSQRWYLHLYDETGTRPLRLGTKIVLNYPLLARHLPGYLIAKSATPLAGKMEDLADIALYYVDAASAREQVTL